MNTGLGPCPHCFESSGYEARVHSATWYEPAWADADPMRPCSECDGTGYVAMEDATDAELFEEFDEAFDALCVPRRCDTNQVGGMGECLACDAEQGVACQLPNPS